jgi:hypothetical protein
MDSRSEHPLLGATSLAKHTFTALGQSHHLITQEPADPTREQDFCGSEYDD